MDRAGHDVDPGIAVALRDLAEDRLDRLVHHQLGRVARVMGDGLGLDQVAALHAQRGRQGGVEIAPVDRLGRRLQLMQRCGRRFGPGLAVVAEKGHARSSRSVRFGADTRAGMEGRSRRGAGGGGLQKNQLVFWAPLSECCAVQKEPLSKIGARACKTEGLGCASILSAISVINLCGRDPP